MEIPYSTTGNSHLFRALPYHIGIARHALYGNNYDDDIICRFSVHNFTTGAYLLWQASTTTLVCALLLR